VAIVRIEQLYPLPEKQLDAITKKYSEASFLWVQEEPSNMGAWQYMAMSYPKAELELISRKASASPATGFKKKHDEVQKAITKASFA
ncbi:MAG: hypothetical protein HRU40_04585, partial [Saprospiraceae bacterium]|nr:hypothetical protein [Saprospiraceae bacterium]